MKKLLKTLNGISIPFAIYYSLQLVKYVLQLEFTSNQCPISSAIKQFKPTNFSVESKLIFIFKSLSLVSIFVFILSILISLLRLITFSFSPFAEKDNKLIEILNKIIQNTIEQSLIFFSLYSYWFILKTTIPSLDIFVYLIALFLIGRIIFFFGMFINYLIYVPFFRSFSIGMNMFTVIFIIAHSFGINKVLSIYK